MVSKNTTELSMKDLNKTTEEKAKLWIRWKTIIHQGNGIIKLNNVTLYGPVLQDCEKFDNEETMRLDFTSQYLLSLVTPYLVEFNLKNKITQSTTETTFKEATIVDSELGKMSLLQKNDHMLISCEGHHTDDMQRGTYTVYFPSMIYKENLDPYSFF